MTWMFKSARFINAATSEEDLQQQVMEAVETVFIDEGAVTASNRKYFESLPLVQALTQSLRELVAGWKASHAGKRDAAIDWKHFGEELDSRLDAVLEEVRMSLRVGAASHAGSAAVIPADIKARVQDAYNTRDLATIRGVVDELRREYGTAYTTGSDVYDMPTADSQQLLYIADRIGAIPEAVKNKDMTPEAASAVIGEYIKRVWLTAKAAVYGAPNPDAEIQAKREAEYQRLRPLLGAAYQARQDIATEGTWDMYSSGQRLAPLVEAAQIAADLASDYRLSRKNIRDIFLGYDTTLSVLSKLTPENEEEAHADVEKFKDMIDDLSAAGFFDPATHEVFAVRQMEQNLVDMVSNLTPVNVPIPNVINFGKKMRYGDDYLQRAKAESLTAKLDKQAEGKADDGKADPYAILHYLPQLAETPALLAALPNYIDLNVLAAWSSGVKSTPAGLAWSAPGKVEAPKQKQARLMWEGLTERLKELRDPGKADPAEVSAIENEVAAFLKQLLQLPITAEGIRELGTPQLADMAVRLAVAATGEIAKQEGQQPGQTVDIDWARKLASTKPYTAFVFADKVDHTYHADTFNGVMGNHALLQEYLERIPGIPDTHKKYLETAPSEGNTDAEEAFMRDWQGGTPSGQGYAPKLGEILNRLLAEDDNKLEMWSIARSLMKDNPRMTQKRAEQEARQRMEERLLPKAKEILGDEESVPVPVAPVTFLDLARKLWPTSDNSAMPTGDPALINPATLVAAIQAEDAELSDSDAKKLADERLAALKQDWQQKTDELKAEINDMGLTDASGNPVQVISFNDPLPYWAAGKIFSRHSGLVFTGVGEDTPMKRDSKKITKHEEFDRTGGIWEVDQESNTIRRKKMIANACSGAAAAAPYSVGDIVAFATLDSFSLGKIAEIKPETYVLTTDSGTVEVQHDNVFDNVDGQLF